MFQYAFEFSSELSINPSTHLSVVKVSVDLLWFVEEVDHLPERELKVHLAEMEDPAQILQNNNND